MGQKAGPGAIIDGPVAALLSSGHALSVAIGNPDRVPYATRGWSLTVLSARPTRVRLVLSSDDRAHRSSRCPLRGRSPSPQVTLSPCTPYNSRAEAGDVEPATDADRAAVVRFCDGFFGAVQKADGTVREPRAAGPAGLRRMHRRDRRGVRPDAGAGGGGGVDRWRVMTGPPEAPNVSLADLKLCFEGVIPAVVATVAADGTPNVTYLSRVRMVDEERIALSNQFFSKTSRNLAENPRASVLLIEPVTYREYRLALVYERTERRGRVFELLHEDVAAVAALQGMQDVFKLRAADIYRVLHIEVLPGARPGGARNPVPGSGAPDGPGDRCRPRRAEFPAGALSGSGRPGGHHGRRPGGAVRLPPLAAAAARRERHRPVHHRQPRLRSGRRWLGGAGRRGHHRHGRGPLHTDPTRKPGPDGEVLKRGAAGVRDPRRHRPRTARSPCRAWRMPRAESRYPGWRWGKSWACLWSRAPNPSPSTRRTSRLLSIVASVVANAVEVERAPDRSEASSPSPAGGRGGSPVGGGGHPGSLLLGRRQHVRR